MSMEPLSLDIGPIHIDGREDGSVVLANRQTAGMIEMTYNQLRKILVILSLWSVTEEELLDKAYKLRQHTIPGRSSPDPRCGTP